MCLGRLRRFWIEVAVDAKRCGGRDDCDKDIRADANQLSALFLLCDIFLTMGFFLFVTVYFFLTHDKCFLHSLFAGMVPAFKK